MKATLPYPPSANRYWRSFRGRMVLSAEAKKYKAFVQVALAKWPILGGPVALIAHLYRPQKSGDLDNRLKVLGDALNGVAWLDDKQVEEIHAFRHDDKSRPRVEIEVRALGVEAELGPRLNMRSLHRDMLVAAAELERIPVHPSNAELLADALEAGVMVIEEADPMPPLSSLVQPVLAPGIGHVVTPEFQREQTESVVPRRKRRTPKCDTCHGSGRGDCLGTEVECGRCQGTGEDCLED